MSYDPTPTIQKQLTVGLDGWLQDAAGVFKCASPHFDARETSEAGTPVRIDTVVLHNISLPPMTFGSGVVKDFFCGKLDFDKYPELEDIRNLRVSSHFFIERTGVITQFVSCQDRAWHAGVSRFNGKNRCNDFTIGIEIEGTDFTNFEDAQYESLVALLSALSRRYPVDYVVGHSDIAPGRKTDPGPHFDWTRLAREKSAFGSPQFPGAAARMQFSVTNPPADMV